MEYFNAKSLFQGFNFDLLYSLDKTCFENSKKLANVLTKMKRKWNRELDIRQFQDKSSSSAANFTADAENWRKKKRRRKTWTERETVTWPEKKPCPEKTSFFEVNNHAKNNQMTQNRNGNQHLNRYALTDSVQNLNTNSSARPQAPAIKTYQLHAWEKNEEKKRTSQQLSIFTTNTVNKKLW